MNDTPVTDTFFLKQGWWSEDILAFCRKLERQRDEAREEVRRLKIILDVIKKEAQ